MKKLTKDKLTEYINEYTSLRNEIPTISSLREFINDSITSSTEYTIEDKQQLILKRDTNLRYYINEYSLTSFVKQKNRRTKKELNSEQ